MTEFPETRLSLILGVRSPENREAWEEFVLLYRPLIYRMGRRRGLQDADAQDVTQVILARVAGAIEHYESRPEIRFRHWLRRVARNAILTALTRQPKDLGAGGTDALDLLNLEDDTAPAVDNELTTELQREQLLRCAAIVRSEVNLETWQAFELTVIHGQSCEAAAETIGKSIGTVYAARSRIMKRLRDQMERRYGEDQ